MTLLRILSYTLVTLVAFAANSVLCRLALKQTSIDPASFTSIRLMSGAMMLVLLSVLTTRRWSWHGSWTSAFMLFAYAACFSFAYMKLTTATGALILFAVVQVTMVGWGVKEGEKLSVPKIFGLLLAFAGLIVLLLPGLSAPPLFASLLMAAAGLAWGAYSLKGRQQPSPLQASSGNFSRALVFTLLLSLSLRSQFQYDGLGALYAVMSGALASGLGYALWYRVLPYLASTSAASIQLAVPVIAALGGLLLGEPITLRLLLASVAILGGIAVVVYSPSHAAYR